MIILCFDSVHLQVSRCKCFQIAVSFKLRQCIRLGHKVVWDDRPAPCLLSLDKRNKASWERWHVGLSSSELRYDLVTAGYWHITPERMQKGVYSPYGFLDSTFLGSLHSSRCFHTSALSRGLDLQTVLSPTCLVVAKALVGRDTRG